MLYDRCRFWNERVSIDRGYYFIVSMVTCYVYCNFKGIYDLFERTKRKQRKALGRSSPEFTARSIDKNKKRKKKRDKEITFDPRETTVFRSVI